MNYQMSRIKENLEIKQSFTENETIKAKIQEKINNLTLNNY